MTTIRGVLLAATAVGSLLTATAEAAEGFETYSRTPAEAGKSWYVSTVDRGDGEPFCTMGRLLTHGLNGSFSYQPFVDGSAWLLIYNGAWSRIEDGKEYGTAIIRIDGRVWQVSAVGASSGRSMWLYLTKNQDFLPAFWSGQTISFQFPKETITERLTGSAAAIGKLYECYEVLDANGNPFGDSAPVASEGGNPFGNI